MSPPDDLENDEVCSSSVFVYYTSQETHTTVLQHFYWPGLKCDVSKWCKECHTCQLGGKPNQNILQAPLHPIPAFDEPFSHIIIDCHKMSIC